MKIYWRDEIMYVTYTMSITVNYSYSVCSKDIHFYNYLFLNQVVHHYNNNIIAF